jgi:hypothetical protein
MITILKPSSFMNLNNLLGYFYTFIELISTSLFKIYFIFNYSVKHCINKTLKTLIQYGFIKQF